MDKILELYISDHNIKALMNSVCSKYSKNIDHDQIESIKLITLWECIKKYNKDKGAKFTSFLYQRLDFALRNELKKKRKEFNFEDRDYGTKIEIKNNSFNELVDGLSTEDARLLSQKYIHNMTMVEIGEANGYSRETARRKINNAKKVCEQKLKLS